MAKKYVEVVGGSPPALRGGYVRYLTETILVVRQTDACLTSVVGIMMAPVCCVTSKELLIDSEIGDRAVLIVENISTPHQTAPMMVLVLEQPERVEDITLQQRYWMMLWSWRVWEPQTQCWWYSEMVGLRV